MKKVVSTYPGLNLVLSIFNCLSALKNPDVDLPWAKFSSSDLAQSVKASFSQSEEVFYRSHITILFFLYFTFDFNWVLRQIALFNKGLKSRFTSFKCCHTLYKMNENHIKHL